MIVAGEGIGRGSTHWYECENCGPIDLEKVSVTLQGDDFIFDPEPLTVEDLGIVEGGKAQND